MSESTHLSLTDFDYDLPPHLIAQRPLAARGASRLLVLKGAELQDKQFADLPGLLNRGDLLVFNDTRVIHARLHGVKKNGGKIEVLLERPIGRHEALAQIRASHSPQPGTMLLLEGVLEAEVLERTGEFYHLRFAGGEEGKDLLDLLERHGKLPLPPYIKRESGNEDELRYQTVFARAPGSVAAPTAGLHFDQAMLNACAARGVNTAFLTLHVGAGTFQPVRVNALSEHKMHSERYLIPAETTEAIQRTRSAGGRIVAVGTTSLRALEAAAHEGELRSGADETRLFILPGYQFRVIDCLITNFHLPQSTLLMLVSAFGGRENIRRAYAHAIKQAYRFFSYGDAMFITRNDI